MGLLVVVNQLWQYIDYGRLLTLNCLKTLQAINLLIQVNAVFF